MNRVQLCLILLFLTASSFGQPLNRARKKMQTYDFNRAIEILLKASEKSRFQDSAIVLLAECYRMQRNVVESAYWYGKAVDQPNAKPEWYLHYGRMLHSLGEYGKAKDNYNKYLQLNHTDTVVRKYVEQCDLLLDEWMYLPPSYEIRVINSLNSPESDFGPAFFANGFTFSSDRGYIDIDEKTYGWTGRKYLNILFAKPVNPGDFFGEYRKPVMMKNLFNQSYHDGPVAFAGDSIAYFTRSFRDRNAKRIENVKTNFLKIYSTRRLYGEWQKLIPFHLNSLNYSVGHPTLSQDGNQLYFASDMPGGMGGVDLWYCYQEINGWSKPVNLGPKINTTGNEMFPSLRNDGCLFFASDGHPGYGGLDIFCSEPEKKGFKSPQNLMAPINSSFDDFSITWIPGTPYGLFASNRPGGLGLDDIYAFKKLPEIIVKEEDQIAFYKLYGTVKQKETGSVLENINVFILDERTDSVYVVRTDVNGIYRITLTHSARLYVKAIEKEYIPDCLVWPEESFTGDSENKAPRDLLLSRLEIDKTFSLPNIYFDFDKYSIRTDAEPTLDQLVRIMKDNLIRIEIGAHTDCRGSYSYNDRLSDLRAKSVVNYLVKNGINEKRIDSKGFGEYELVNRCTDGIPCSSAEHQANRRIEFKVISFDNEQIQENSEVETIYQIQNTFLFRDQLPADFFMECK